MDLLLLQDFQTLGGVLRLEYLISVTDQINFNQVRNLFLIIHNQNVNIGHGFSSFKFKLSPFYHIFLSFSLLFS